MAVARFFGGTVVKKFDQTGVLLGSAVLATIGVYLFSTQTGGMAYVAAIFFALGVAYFWPNMIGFIADKIPKSGALGMSIVGAVGMFSTSIFQPIIGGWIDSDLNEYANSSLGVSAEAFTNAKNFLENKQFEEASSLLGLTKDELEPAINNVILESGQATLETMTLFPAILIVLFTILFFWVKKIRSQTA
jgi:MFS family permease